MYPDFVTINYAETLGSWVTWKTYLNTLKYAVIVWALTLFIGFWVAYFLAFHIRTATMQMVLFLVCTVPFLTSNIIRMISWIPVLGRNGLVNTGAGRHRASSRQPIEWLLYSDFAVVLAMVHLYTLFMVTPIFNTLMRIDRSLIEAARDAGANGWQILWNVILPLAKPGMAIGTIFVVTLVMADFSTVQVMSGGQSASVALMMKNQMSLLQYPAAAANAVVLLDRSCCSWSPASCASSTSARSSEHEPRKARPRILRARGLLRAVRAVPLRTAVGDPHPVLPGPERRPDLPAQRRLGALVRQPVRDARRSAISAAAFRRSLLLGPDGDGGRPSWCRCSPASPSAASSSARRRCST